MLITRKVKLVSFPIPYLTSGLIGFWDGEWNAAPGVHDPALQKWCDISGHGHDLEKTYLSPDYPEYTARWGDNYYCADYGFKTNLQATGLDAIYDALESEATVEFVSCYTRVEPDGGQGVNFFKSDPSRVLFMDPANNSAAQGPVTAWRFHNWEEAHKNNYAEVYMPKNRISEVYGRHTCAAVISNGICRVLIDNILKKTLVGNRLYARTWDGLRVRTMPATVGKYYGLRIYRRALTPDELARNHAVDQARFGG